MAENEEFDPDFSSEEIPISEEFWDWMESYWHNNRDFPESTESHLKRKADLVDGKVPASQLPSYVDDVLEFDSFENLPAQGEKGKIYILTNNNHQYRWSGSEYIQMNSDINLVTTNTNQNITGRKSFFTLGGDTTNNHSLRVYSGDGSNPGISFYKSGVNVGNLYYNGSQYFFTNSDNALSAYTNALGYKKSGSSDSRILLGGGGDKAISDFYTAVQADGKFIPYTGATSDLTLGAKNVNLVDGSISKVGNNFVRIFHKVYQNHLPSAQTGILSLKFPQASTAATMFDVILKIYGYNSRFLGNIRVSFYKISNTSIHSTGSKAIIECTDNFPSTIINAGIDADGNVRINIGEPTTVWNAYMTVEVDRVASMYTGYNGDWSKGWVQSMENDVSTYQSILNITPDIVATRSWVQNTALAEYLKTDGSNNMTGSLNFTAGAVNFKNYGSIQAGNVNRIRLSSGSTIISTGGTGEIYLRPQGDGIATGQAYLNNAGTLVTSSHGSSDQWNQAYTSGFLYKGLLGTANLNTITIAGHYVQTSNSNATPDNNYPYAWAGILKVFGTNSHLEQQYTTYQSNLVFRRYFYNGTWSTWIKELTEVDITNFATTNTLQDITATKSFTTLQKFREGAKYFELNPNSAYLRKYENKAIYAPVLSSATGNVKITFPFTMSGTMWSIKVKVLQYAAASTNTKTVQIPMDITITGYNVSAGSANVNWGASGNNFHNNFVGVRIGYDVVTNNKIVWLDFNATLNYPKVIIEEIITHHAGSTNSLSDGNWDMVFTTDETDYTHQSTILLADFKELVTDSKIALWDAAGLEVGSNLKVLGNGVAKHNLLGGDAFSFRNSSVWAGGTNRPNNTNSAVVNFTSYSSGGLTYGFSFGARNNRLYFATEEASVFGNWNEVYHSGNTGSAPFVPYTGATNNIDLNAKSITNASLISGTDLTASKSAGGNVNIGTGGSAGTTPVPIYANLNFLGYANNVIAKISAGDSSGNTTLAPLVFYTRNQVSGSTVLQESMRIAGNGETTIANLAGTGNRMVVANSAGQLSTQEIINTNSFFPKTNVSSVNTDLNTLSLEGFYYGYQWTNKPVGSSSIAAVTVKRYSNDWIRQEYAPIDGLGLIYVRDRISGTTWGNWILIATQDWAISQFVTSNTSMLKNVTRPGSADFDTYKTQGFYALGSNLTNGPTGAGSWGNLLVTQSASDRFIQMYFDQSNNNVYFRNGTGSTTTWGSWKLIADRDWVSANYMNVAHQANSITATNISNWNTAFDSLGNYYTKNESDSKFIQLSQKGQTNGIATLGADGLIPTTQLPSYVDDVIEADDFSSLNALSASEKQTGKIYVTIDTNKSYRWSGSIFVEISSGAVQSVNGKTGIVNLTNTDLGAAALNHTHTIAQVTGLQGALDGKVDDSQVLTNVPANAVFTDTIYTLPTATSTVKGGVEIFSDTVQSVASNAVTATANRTYGIQLNSAGQTVVNIPWTDNNTTYSNGTGLNLTGTAFSVNFGTAAGTVAQGNDLRINNGQTAFSWGNHANAGYITQNNLSLQLNDYVTVNGFGPQDIHGQKAFSATIIAAAGIQSLLASPDEIFVGNSDTIQLDKELINDGSSLRYDHFEYYFDTGGQFDVNSDYAEVDVTVTAAGVELNCALRPKQKVVVTNLSDGPVNLDFPQYGSAYTLEPGHEINLRLTEQGSVLKSFLVSAFRHN